MPKPTTEQREIMIDCFLEGLPDKKTAEKAGLKLKQVQNFKCIFGMTNIFPRNHYHPIKWDEGSAKVISRLWRETHDADVIAEHFGVKRSTLAWRLSRMRSRGMHVPYLYL